MKRRRIFIAINLPENIKKELVKHQKRIQEMFTLNRNEASGSGSARWTKTGNIHITLAFLGYVLDEQIPEICKAAEETVSKYNSFDVNLNKICYGPLDKKPPRMVWATGGKVNELSSLKNELGERLGVFEGREFIPHITLARISQWAWRRIEPEERPEINEDINLNFPVNSVEVMESMLRKGGPEYIVLESYNLNL